MIRPGTQLDRYEVEAEIGRGGMAVVYRVRHRTLGSVHALKVLFLPAPGLHERVVQEGRLQASLRHPNIVAVTDVVDVDGVPGLIMDLVEGAPLESWLADVKPSLEARLALFREIVSGVRAAHERGLVHRDLKPANVLVTWRDGRHVPMITDFGLAKVLGQEALSATRSNISMGTPAYMAPEQIRNAKAVDQRADVFSLGALLYRMVCDRAAFEGEDVLGVLYATAAGRYPPPRAVVPDLPDAVARTIEGCLRPRMEDRLASCDAVLMALDGGAVPPAVTPRPSAGAVISGPRRPLSADSIIDEEPIGLDELEAPERAEEASVEEPTVARRQGRGIVLAIGVALLGILVWLLLPAGQAPTSQGGDGEIERNTGVTDAVAPRAEPAPTVVATPEPPPAAEPPSVPTPEPASASSVPAASAAPASPASPAASPRAAAASRAQVRLTGEASSVWLEAGGARIALGGTTRVAAGSYAVIASFAGAEAVSAGQLELGAGETVNLSCSQAFLRCKAVSP